MAAVVLELSPGVSPLEFLSAGWQMAPARLVKLVSVMQTHTISAWCCYGTANRP